MNAYNSVVHWEGGVPLAKRGLEKFFFRSPLSLVAELRRE